MLVFSKWNGSTKSIWVGSVLFLSSPHSFLDRETEKINILVEKCEPVIELLKEYRTFLITAVTDKIDVRNIGLSKGAQRGQYF